MSKENINIWINGAFGKMGTELVSFLKDNKQIIITGVISPAHEGQIIQAQSSKLEVAKDLDTLLTNCEAPNVVVDFTIAQVAFEAAIFCAKNNISFVSGTTGISQSQKDTIVKDFDSSSAKAIIAPNFSVGVVLMMEFSAKAAPFFKEIEIVETHHTRKVDAPSGTAITTANMVEVAREEAGIETKEIPIHSLRLSGAVAHQQVMLSSHGEILRIEHDANDRSCFMPGVIMSIEKVLNQKHVLFTIAHLLFNN